MSTMIRHRVEEEFRALLPVTIFFLIALHILTISRALMLRSYGVHISALAGATVGALLIAKVVLIVDHLPFVNRFPERPLIYNVVWKTTIYALSALLVHYLEHLLPAWWHSGSLATAQREVLEHVIWPHFWALQLWLVVLLFVYAAFRELVRVVGAERVRTMFFGGPSFSPPGREQPLGARSPIALSRSRGRPHSSRRRRRRMVGERADASAPAKPMGRLRGPASARRPGAGRTARRDRRERPGAGRARAPR